MLKQKNKKGFTLIELIVVMAVIGILVLLGMPKLSDHIKEAKFTKIINNQPNLSVIKFCKKLNNTPAVSVKKAPKIINPTISSAEVINTGLLTRGKGPNLPTFTWSICLLALVF